MKNYNLDRILRPAFKLFLTYNYESVSTAKLETTTGLTRGAIFYKLKSKEEIFRAVIDKYIFENQSQPSEIQAGSLREFIEVFLKQEEVKINDIKSLNIVNIYRSYFGLIFQAIQYYSGFEEKWAAILDGNLKKWVEVIQQAKESGEIKPSCDVTAWAQKFRYTYSGICLESSLSNGIDLAELSTLYHSYYDEMKK